MKVSLVKFQIVVDTETGKMFVIRNHNIPKLRPYFIARDYFYILKKSFLEISKTLVNFHELIWKEQAEFINTNHKRVKDNYEHSLERNVRK